MSKNFYVYNLGKGKNSKRDLKQPELILLSCLIHICKAYEKKFPLKEGRCFLNNIQLSKKTGLNKDRINQYLSDLRSMGYIKEFEENNTRAIVVNMDNLTFVKDTTKGFYIPEDILLRKDLSISEKLIFGYMTSFGFKDKDINVKNKTILDLLKIKSNKTLSLALNKFKDLDLIDVTYESTKNTNLANRRSIKVNKELARNYIEKVEVTVTNNVINNNIIGNTINNDNRVINYYISLTKDEYEEFLRNRNIDDILGKDES